MTKSQAWSRYLGFRACSRQVSREAMAAESSRRPNWSSARDLTLEAARDAGASRKSGARQLPASQIKKLLDSRNEREVLDGLRRVVAVCK